MESRVAHLHKITKIPKFRKKYFYKFSINDYSTFNEVTKFLKTKSFHRTAS